MKNCSNENCTQINPQLLSQFTKDKSKKDGLKIWCVICCRNYEKQFYNSMENKNNRQKYKKVYDKKYYFDNKDIYKDRQLYRNYGITLEEYNQMLIEQNHKCAICGKDELEVGTLCVDHKHVECFEKLFVIVKKTYIRDLVCMPCNTALGLLKEDIEILDRVKLYLIKWKNK